MSEQENYIEVLIDTLKKQEEVLGKIYAITKEQSEIAEASEFDELMLEDTLNRKEILIAKLNELDAGFTSVYGRVRAEIREHQEQYKEEVLKMQKLIKECTDIGVAIKVLEERNRDKMMQCFSNQYKKYSAKRTAASVASQYNQTMKSGNVANSYFMDKKIKFFKKYYKVLEKDSDIYSVRLKQSDNNSLEILYILITEARASSTCSKDATSNSRRNSLW